MSYVARAIETIQSAEQEIGLPELARMSGVPYTTLIEWKTKGFRPKAVRTLEKLLAAAEARSKSAAARPAEPRP